MRYINSGSRDEKCNLTWVQPVHNFSEAWICPDEFAYPKPDVVVSHVMPEVASLRTVSPWVVFANLVGVGFSDVAGGYMKPPMPL
jgi:hypothetical protein